MIDLSRERASVEDELAAARLAHSAAADEWQRVGEREVMLRDRRVLVTGNTERSVTDALDYEIAAASITDDRREAAVRLKQARERLAGAQRDFANERIAAALPVWESAAQTVHDRRERFERHLAALIAEAWAMAAALHGETLAARSLIDYASAGVASDLQRDQVRQLARTAVPTRISEDGLEATRERPTAHVFGGYADNADPRLDAFWQVIADIARGDERRMRAQISEAMLAAIEAAESEEARDEREDF